MRGEVFMARYEYGGDEFIFVELAEEMSLEVNFQAMAITKQLKEEQIPGILDICPSNASYMVRFEPEKIHPDKLISKLKDLEQTISIDDFELSSRMVDVPVLFEDPWTHETVMRFRERHQDPNSTDLEYTARINGFDSTDALIDAMTGSPYLVTMIGFVPGLPWCYQMVPREQQIEAPKYVRPRTFTPERAFGLGGAFTVIYPVDGAGGYQLFGIAAAPIFEKDSKLYDFQDTMTFPKQGDIFRYRSVTREEYDSIRKEVEDGTFRYLTKEITFTPKQVLDNPKAFSEEVLRRLYS
ncbi:5-oxoprolinase subunit B family protein [Siminovitchia fortis]|nr:allophanate hydrolase subunit 1 [Siminovitchia fortis]WHY80793.1 allophanate hydrolase subunit 1 [Siminovitchia fortis]